MKKLWLVLLYLVAAAADAAPTAPVPLIDFARTDTYDSPSLSPDGKYLALRFFNGQDYDISIVELGAGKKPFRFAMGAGASVHEYAWASSTRLVFSLAENFGADAAPSPTGEIYAIDVDGKRGNYLFGFRGEGVKTGTRIGRNTRENAYGELIRTLPDDPDHVLIAYYNWDALIKDREVAIAARIHTVSGKRDQEVSAPIPGRVWFTADRSGFVRYVVGTNREGKQETYVRTPEAPKWRLLGSIQRDRVVGDEDSEFGDAELSADGRFAYRVSNELTGRNCLLLQDIDSGQIQPLSCDEQFDAAGIVRSPIDNEPVAVLYEGGIPRLDILKTDNRGAALVRGLQKAFPGMIAYPVSRTPDGSKAIVYSYSDRNPGDYYLFDVASRKADYLGGAREWIDPARMAERRPITLQARDGAVLRGFLTLPPGREPKHLPLVVMPHGGPFGSQDTWDWDADAQMLASRGYAVLQVNFRGSGGFGKAFQEQGRNAWHTRMIDDISDAARWTISQGYADANRLCIYGASYGGYAALMSAVREPELYRCAVGLAGVYDLQRWKRETDVSDSRLGRRYIAEEIGSTDEELRAASPITYLDKLKAAVMIVHGKRDLRAPFSQAEALRDALKARHYPFEWMAVEGEGHGFYRSENRVALYEKLLEFLDRNIGADALSGSSAKVQP